MAKYKDTLKEKSTWAYMLVGWLLSLLFSPNTLMTWVKGLF